MRNRILGQLGACFLLLSLAIAPTAAQKIEASGNISKTATITAINPTTRVVTLKDAAGNIEDIQCGPEIKRFGELKVGDSVTFSYHAAVVAAIVKGAAAIGDKAEVGAVRGQGAKPSGAITSQHHASATIEAIDPSVPSIKVKLADGHSMNALVADRKNLEGVKVGDKISVTFTEALMVTVEAPKK
jgi:hypothetical protein